MWNHRQPMHHAHYDQEQGGKMEENVYSQNYCSGPTQHPTNNQQPDVSHCLQPFQSPPPPIPPPPPRLSDGSPRVPSFQSPPVHLPPPRFHQTPPVFLPQRFPPPPQNKVAPHPPRFGSPSGDFSHSPRPPVLPPLPPVVPQTNFHGHQPYGADHHTEHESCLPSEQYENKMPLQSTVHNQPYPENHPLPMMPPPHFDPTENFVKESTKTNENLNMHPPYGEDVKDTSLHPISGSEIKCSTHEKDQQWLEQWIKRKQLWHCPVPETKKSITISVPDARRMLNKSLKLVKELKQLRFSLQEHVNSNRETWEALYNEANVKKKELEEIQEKMDDKFVMNLNLKLKKIQKKRARLRCKRKQRFEEQQEILQRREELHATIDKWQQDILKKDADAKKEKEVKAAADETMSEVRRKLTDIRKLQQLMQALQKLRQLRKETAEQQKRYTSRESDRVFKERMDNLFVTVKRRTEIYEAEQKTLEVMLEMEQKQTDVQDREAERLKLEAKTKRKENQIRELLFGKEVVVEPCDPMYISTQYYSQSSSSLAALCHVRQEWDIYLVPDGTPGGSKIPQGWVVPVEPSSDRWASAL